MRLQQNQTWQLGDEYVRIVRLERLQVEYKAMKDLYTKEGKHHQVTKKEFCRLLKGAVLLPPAETPKQEPDSPPEIPSRSRPRSRAVLR